MKYGGDKIKLITDDLNKGDDLQMLGFDTCGYALIGKWNDEYGTKGDSLVSDDVPCWVEGNCPICQEKITDVMNLPGRPEPCSSGDAFLMLSKNKELKVMCKSSFECEDKYVAISSGDETPGYLKDKLIVCDSNSPLEFVENSAGSSHTYCLKWKPENAGLKFIDLKDTPSSYESPGLLFSDGDGISMMKPEVCSGKDFSYLIYRKDGSFDTLCPVDSSVVDRYLKADYEFEITAGTTTRHNVKNNDSVYMEATPDILVGSGDVLFYLTKPGIYLITLNCTLLNETQAWMKGARGGITVDGVERGDAKYDSRAISDFINEEYPSDSTSSSGTARDGDLGIMSFNTSYIIVFKDISATNPASIGIGVKPDCRTEGDPRGIKGEDNKRKKPDGGKVKFKLTAGGVDEGSKTRLSAMRVGEVPKTYARILG